MKKIIIIGATAEQLAVASLKLGPDYEVVSELDEDTLPQKDLAITSDLDTYLIHNYHRDIFIPKVKHLPKGHEKPYKYHK